MFSIQRRLVQRARLSSPQLVRYRSSAPSARGTGRLSGVKAIPYAEIVNEHSDLQDNVEVLNLEELINASNEPNFAEENRSARTERLDIDTRQGKTAGNKLLVLPEEITSVISNATRGYTPNRLRSNASKYYLSLAESGAHRPATETIDVDTHLTGVFLQNYASLYNVLKEARQRLGEKWRPNRILDVGFGPATGMIALNEVFSDVDAEDWQPERKLAIVIGHRDMKKRAVSVLATQKHEESEEQGQLFEENEEALTEEEQQELEEILAVETKGLEETQQEELDVNTEETDSVNEIEFEEIPKTKQKAHIKTVVRQQLPAAKSSSKYDLIIATHQLYRSGYHYPASVDDHTSHLLSLLSPGGILVLVERGDPTGFESIARARQIMFRPEDHQSPEKYPPRLWKNDEQFPLSIVAPCSHHGKCPLQVELGIRNKGKNPAYFGWCKFAQMVQRPKFALELKKGQLLSQKWSLVNTASGKVSGEGGKSLAGSGRAFGRSFETATHSYLIVERKAKEQKGTNEQSQELELKDDSISDPASWPRILQNPLKRDKHVVMEVCAPSGQVEQWTVTQKFGKQAYHDARKATGGDLWALGAKVKQVRGGNLSKLRKASAKIQSESRRATKENLQAEIKIDEKVAAEIQEENVDSESESKAPDAIDIAWLRNDSFNSQKMKRKQAYTRGSEPGAYEDIDGGFSSEYFDDLAQVFENKKAKDYAKKLEKSSHVEKKRVMKW
ncbi:mitochondrial 37S ribosomal protein RSM22 [Sugiyamaella lignohabitans]|uniref:Mitochondrial 37S ribosomal protein RSM22 n=1 Tax=Sugiyamaella lignohabitans TaxID=796027 RepID=A0A167EAA3_9ASCO|nr:mitochondrial 37S ribosomal protein RSM22 [Sugiyamaella lignohabitans]ANB13831.1 mitochondrial 37S ribosomal protein RSM22 [Sugiyamaella lignohabitans]